MWGYYLLKDYWYFHIYEIKQVLILNPNSFNLVFYQHALQLCLCLLLGLLCSSRRVTELGLNILCICILLKNELLKVNLIIIHLS